MERWNCAINCDIENEKIDAFLGEVTALCRKHRLSIGHKDCHGGFLVEKYSKHNEDWLMDAADAT